MEKELKIRRLIAMFLVTQVILLACVILQYAEQRNEAEEACCMEAFYPYDCEQAELHCF